MNWSEGKSTVAAFCVLFLAAALAHSETKGQRRNGKIAQAKQSFTGAWSGDASERQEGAAGPGKPDAPLAYRTSVSLDKQILRTDGVSHRLASGMQVSAEIKLGDRTILEYLLSPVQKAFHEAGRDR